MARLYGALQPWHQEPALQGPGGRPRACLPRLGGGAGSRLCLPRSVARAVPAPALPLIGQPGNLAGAPPLARVCPRGCPVAGAGSARGGAPVGLFAFRASTGGAETEPQQPRTLPCLNPARFTSVTYARLGLLAPHTAEGC